MGQKVQTIPFTESDIKEYLDRSITHWRWQRDETLLEEEGEEAACYIDAFQSMRLTLFGEELL